jgi:hypothetical protein
VKRRLVVESEAWTKAQTKNSPDVQTSIPFLQRAPLVLVGASSTTRSRAFCKCSSGVLVTPNYRNSVSSPAAGVEGNAQTAPFRKLQQARVSHPHSSHILSFKMWQVVAEHLHALRKGSSLRKWRESPLTVQQATCLFCIDETSLGERSTGRSTVTCEDGNMFETQGRLLSH